MSIVFAQPTAQTRLAALGQALAGGTLEFQTSGEVEVATVGLASSGDPASAFSGISGKVGTFGDMTPDSDATGGVIALAVFKDSGGTERYRVNSITTIGGGGDIELPSLTIPAGGVLDMNDSSPVTFTEP